MDRRQFLKRGLFAAAAFRLKHDYSALERFFVDTSDWHADKKQVLKKEIYLTIDDGPRDNMDAIMNSLDADDKATFFMVGQLINTKQGHEKACEALVRGHEIGNHSYTHPNFAMIPIDRAKKEIELTDKVIEKVHHDCGVKRTKKLFRFPYGYGGNFFHRHFERLIDPNDKDKKKELGFFLESMGYKTYFWNIDTKDWKYAAHKISIEKAMLYARQAKNNDIVLVHDNSLSAKIIVPFYAKSDDYVLRTL